MIQSTAITNQTKRTTTLRGESSVVRTNLVYSASMRTDTMLMTSVVQNDLNGDFSDTGLLPCQSNRLPLSYGAQVSGYSAVGSVAPTAEAAS